MMFDSLNEYIKSKNGFKTIKDSTEYSIGIILLLLVISFMSDLIIKIIHTICILIAIVFIANFILDHPMLSESLKTEEFYHLCRYVGMILCIQIVLCWTIKLYTKAYIKVIDKLCGLFD